jgi:flavin reductase (DIM6/NTAB) family NADH-FMN oxidoreductase RutF
MMRQKMPTVLAGLAAIFLASVCLGADAPEKAQAAPFKGPVLADLYKSISPKELGENPIRLIGDDWMLITAGTPEKFNSMTAGWGGYGMWKKPVAFILVKPSRYTFQFLEKEEYFTLSFYDPAKYRDVLRTTFGSKSGRDIDKVKVSGFTPMLTNPGIAYSEARMIIVCKKTFSTTPDPDVTAHKLYFGEIQSVWVKKP